MAKKRKKSQKNSKLIYVVWFLSIIALSIGLFIVGYYLGSSDASLDTQKQEVKVEQKTKIEDRLKKVIKEESKVESSKKLEPKLEAKKDDSNETKTQDLEMKTQSVESNDTKEMPKKEEGASHEIDSSTKVLEPLKKVKHKGSTTSKLAIIIDDVSTKSQVDAIKKLGLNLTMSFLPPSKERPSSYVLAQKEKFYMVHLPMEAMKFNKEEPHTLRVSDNKEELSKRIDEIVKLFPRVKYINNHTGSKFTSDFNAVDRLVGVLNAKGINFLDSRTIAESKVEQVMKKYGKNYVSRDVFLDHEQDKEYVKNQIKKAVLYAKEHGEAVAIGHPHPNTLKALEESKELLKSVDLVLVDKVF